MKLSKQYLRDGEPVVVTAVWIEGDRWRVQVGEVTYEFCAQAVADGGVRMVQARQPLAGQPQAPAVTAYGAAAGREFMVRVHGRTHTLPSPETRRGGAGAGSDGTIRAPMTGTVLDVLCKVGDAVAADQTLVVLSAMKMEHKLTAGVAGIVQSLAAKKDGTVDQGAVLAVVEAIVAAPVAGSTRQHQP